MRSSTSEFFQRLADAFMAGDHGWLAECYTYPMVVYVHEEIFLERTPAETLNSLFDRREKALRAGTRKIESTVIEIGKDSNGRFPVRVQWRFLSETGRVLAMNDLRYYCRYTEQDDLKIEILEFLHRGFEKDGTPKTSSLH